MNGVQVMACQSCRKNILAHHNLYRNGNRDESLSSVKGGRI